jgi:hypothetical protein
VRFPFFLKKNLSLSLLFLDWEQKGVREQLRQLTFIHFFFFFMVCFSPRPPSGRVYVTTTQFAFVDSVMVSDPANQGVFSGPFSVRLVGGSDGRFAAVLGSGCYAARLPVPPVRGCFGPGNGWPAAATVAVGPMTAFVYNKRVVNPG